MGGGRVSGRLRTLGAHPSCRKMNILFIDSSRTWGGGGVWLLQICEGLIALGHQITVICRPDSALTDRIRPTKVTLHTLPMTGDFHPLSIYSIHRIIKSRRMDIVCANMEKELRLAGLAARWAGVPIVVSREVDRPLKDTWINRYFYNRVASGVMVNSFATYNTLLASAPWLGEQRCEIVWKGVDVGRYRGVLPSDVRREFGLQPNDCIAGFVGRLDEQKGIPTLLEAMKIAVPRSPRLRLILAGEGNLRPKIEAFRRSNRLEDRIFLAGFRDDVPAFLRAIDFLVMPSYWEGFGYGAAEAMAAGKPVIGSWASSLPEIVDHRRTGILVAPRSPEDLARAMVELGADPGARQEMGNAGSLRVERMFPLSRMVSKTESFFFRVVESYRSDRGSRQDDQSGVPPAD